MGLQFVNIEISYLVMVVLVLGVIAVLVIVEIYQRKKSRTAA